MSGLRISKSLSLPLEFVTSTTAILARKGSGKTYTAKVLMEELVKAGQQFISLDPVGVMHGIRSSADGKKEGYPVLIIGGDHGDVPLEPTAGEAIADFLIETRTQAIIDLGNLSNAQMKRFAADFAERLYQKNREPLHLIVDEADMFIPQKPVEGEQRMLGAFDKIVRRGRARGLGLTMITQRPAAINKNALTQVENLILLRLMSPQDRDAVEAWTEVHGTKDDLKEMMASLPSLPVGTAWLWSPGLYFDKIQIRTAETFDSSATPKVGESKREPTAFAQLDLPMLEAAMSRSVEEAQANDPKALRQRIAQLEKQLKDGADPKALHELYERGFRDGKESLRDILSPLMRACSDVTTCLLNEFTHTTVDKPAEFDDGFQIPDKEIPQFLKEHKAKKPLQVADGVSGPQMRILVALAQFLALGLRTVSKGNVAVFSDQSPKSSGFRANLSALSAKGLIRYESGEVLITETGEATAGEVDRPSGIGDLHEAWLVKLSRPQGKILRKLIELYPDGIHRSALATATNQSLTSSGYRANLSKLSGLGLLKYVGPEVHATELLFPDLKVKR